MDTSNKYKEYLSPQEISQEVIDWAKTHLSQGGEDTFINELCFIDRARRADLVLANGSLSAFEIKSERDTLSRWQGQQEDYLTCFEKVWLCVHAKHIEPALQKTHGDVGVLVIDDFSSISMLRRAGRSSQLDIYNLTGFLWRADLDRLGRAYDLQIRSRMRIKEVRQIIANELPVNIINKFVIETLKSRYSLSSDSSMLGDAK